MCCLFMLLSAFSIKRILLTKIIDSIFSINGKKRKKLSCSSCQMDQGSLHSSIYGLSINNSYFTMHELDNEYPEKFIKYTRCIIIIDGFQKNRLQKAV